MLTKLQLHLQQHFPFLLEKKLLLAVSGGIDSMVLLETLDYLKYSIVVAHCNFSLRDKESDGDEQFLIEYCKKRNIKIITQKFDTLLFADDYKLSIQQAARKLRYDWFYEILQSENLDYILTAHHLDDSLETFIINFSRGTGLNGLTGIPEQNDKIIRPLLSFSRSEIEDFAQKIKLNFREDSSNSSNKYLRNKLRHEVIPVLKEIEPNLLNAFETTIKNLKQAQSMVDDAAKLIFNLVATEEEELIKFNLIELLKLPNYDAYLHHWLKDYGFTAWDDITALVHAQSGKQIFSENYVVLKNRDYLLLYKKNENIDVIEEFTINENERLVKIPLNIDICNVSDISYSDSNTIFVDAETLHFPLVLRKWNEGDVFYPKGMNGKKKISKFFKDEKYSLIDKLNQWLLCSNNQIVWVVGKRQDERFLVTSLTKKILKITLQ